MDASLPRFGHYIDGAVVEPVAGAYLPTDNPYTGKAWATIARGNRADAEAAVTAAERAFDDGAWPALTPSERGRLLWRLGDSCQANAERLARDRAARQRQAAAEVIAQVRYMGDYFKYYAGLADKVAERTSSRPTRRACSPTRATRPKGVVAIITPWNSPLTLTSWKLAPALAAGCTAVVKPSEFTSASMVEFAKLFAEAGFPEGRRQRRHRPRARGRRGAGHAPEGRAHRLHRRLGGGPQDLRAGGAQLQDRDARARRQVAEHRVRRRRPRPGGQGRRLRHLRGDRARAARPARGCCVQSLDPRPLRRQADRLRARRRSSATRPLPDTQIGPVATRPQFEKVLSYIEIAKDEGATCVFGGRSRPDLGAGQFVEPTIFTGVQQRHAHRAGGSLRPGARGDPLRGRGRRDPRSATTSPTASPPPCGRATCAAPC